MLNKRGLVALGFFAMCAVAGYVSAGTATHLATPAIDNLYEIPEPQSVDREKKGDLQPIAVRQKTEALRPAKKPIKTPLWGPGPMPDTCVSDYTTPRYQLVFPGHCIT